MEAPKGPMSWRLSELASYKPFGSLKPELLFVIIDALVRHTFRRSPTRDDVGLRTKALKQPTIFVMAKHTKPDISESLRDHRASFSPLSPD